jgi:hypothetical protein
MREFKLAVLHGNGQIPEVRVGQVIYVAERERAHKNYLITKMNPAKLARRA